MDCSASKVQLEALKTGKVLVAGCGMSDFSSDLAAYGLSDVTSIDYSATAIAEQNKKPGKPGLKYEVNDVRRMNGMADKSYDAVFAKATIDALLCAEGANANIFNAMNEIRRVLKPGGRFVCISHSPQEDREHHFQDTCWEEDPYFVSFVRPSITEEKGSMQIAQRICSTCTCTQRSPSKFDSFLSFLAQLVDTEPGTADVLTLDFAAEYHHR